MLLYEKYRPRSFQEVLGQEKAVKTLERLLERSWGGQAFWLSGPSGTGKTTIARIIAETGADELCIREFDSADKLDAAALEDIDREMSMYGWGKGGRAYIVNEAHGLRAPIVRRLLGLLERIPQHVVWIFTTTADGLALFEDCQTDASPLLSRCTCIRLTSQGLLKVFAAHVQRIAQSEGLDGKPLAAYEQLARDCRNNCRAMLQEVASGRMMMME